MDKILNKIDMFLTSESRVYGEKVDGMRPIQFMKWFGDFRPGDRCDAEFSDNYINLTSASMGSFSGVKKEMNIEKKKEIEDFKALEGDIWNLC